MRTFVILVNEGSELVATNWYATAWPWLGKAWLSWHEGAYRLLMWDSFSPEAIQDGVRAEVVRGQWSKVRQMGAGTGNAVRIEWYAEEGQRVYAILMTAKCVEGWPEDDCMGNLYVYDDDGREMSIDEAMGATGALRKSIEEEVGRIGRVKKVWAGPMRYVKDGGLLDR